MGRTALADSRIQTYVDKLMQENGWYLGLIIGKLTNQKDIALHLVRTPEPLEDQASDDDDGQTDSSEVEPAQKRKVPFKPSSLEAMNEQWAATHAKQVTTMLPGGISVIGIFAMATPNMMKSSEAKLRQVLFAIQKVQKKSPSEGLPDSVTDRYLLQICSTTKKFTCRTIDVNDPKSSFRPADWKTSNTPERWNRLDTDLGLNLPICIPQTSRSSLPKQIQTGLQPFCKRVENCMVLFDGSPRDTSETLDQSTTERKGKGRDKSQTSQRNYYCHVLVKMSDSTSKTDPTISDCTRLVLRGKIHGRGYVTSKATVEEAQNALKTDIIRSVTSRCELLGDDLQVIEEDAEQQEVYSTPRRVFFPLPDTSIELSDYMFADEKPGEVLSRIQELLDLEIAEEQLDLELEQAPMEADFEVEEMGTQEDDTANTATDKNNNLKYQIVAGIGGMVAFLAAGISYIMSEQF